MCFVKSKLRCSTCHDVVLLLMLIVGEMESGHIRLVKIYGTSSCCCTQIHFSDLVSV